ncbi:hypothetical protein VTO42DRAFT_264 [Malbranchea cinnamomea]
MPSQPAPRPTMVIPRHPEPTLFFPGDTLVYEQRIYISFRPSSLLDGHVRTLGFFFESSNFLHKERLIVAQLGLMGDFGPSLSPRAAQLPHAATDDSTTAEDINVLVTGFGPFKTNPINPSFLIASSLPQSISSPATSSAKTHQIRIHTHPNAIRVSYAAVRAAVPAIIESFKRSHNGAEPDIIIHIGMASTRHHYAVETRAHRDGYNVTDVDGQVGLQDGEIPWKEAGLPEVLQPGPRTSISSGDSTTPTPTNKSATESTTVSLTRVCPRPPDELLLSTWRKHLPDQTDVRLSDEAGRYLCEFIYYTSLARALQAGRDRNVVFLHVPGWTDEMSVERGKNVVIALIKALVACWIDGAPKAEMKRDV